MRRRDLLATVASAAAAATAGCDSFSESLIGGTETSDHGAVTIETLDAPGSKAGTTTVPAPDRVTFVEFFATTCEVCASQMPVLGRAREGVNGVQFLSVTSEPVGLSVSKAEVATWWETHGGHWTVGVDDGTELARRYDATSVPKAVVIEPEGSATWSHTGRTDAETIIAEIETVGERP